MQGVHYASEIGEFSLRLNFVCFLRELCAFIVILLSLCSVLLLTQFLMKTLFRVEINCYLVYSVSRKIHTLLRWFLSDVFP